MSDARGLEQIRGVPPDSILAMLTTEAEDFTGREALMRWITRRYDKLALPFILILTIFVFGMYQMFRDPTPIFGLSLGQIFAFGFLIFLLLLLSMLLGSNFLLTMKAGKGKGNFKFNLIDKKTGTRMNDIEIDAIVKNHYRINRNTQRFAIFEDLIDAYGKLDLPHSFLDEEIKIESSFSSLSGDPIIAEIQKEVKDWNITIPEVLVPEKFRNEEEKKRKEASKQYVAGGQQLVVHNRNIKQSMQNPFDIKTTIREVSPLFAFLEGSSNVYVHVIDFQNEFEYKGKKYPGLIFLHEKKTLQEIFPDPSKAFCMVGWTFGDIPVISTQFVEIEKYKNVPIFYPDVTRDRLMKIATLGFYDDELPSLREVMAAKNLIELEVALPLMQYVQFIERRFATLDENQKKMLRKELAVADRALGTWKKVHLKEEKKEWVFPFVIGFLLCLILYPYLQWIFGIFAQLG